MASVPQSKNKQKQDWQSHICQLVRPHLPEFKEKQECLDFLCGDGSISLELFDELHRTDGITVVIVTHSPSVAEHCARTIAIADGRVVESGADALEQGGR